MVLHLVRHAPPRIDVTLPAHAWPLAESADESVAALRTSHVLPMDAAWITSPEPKARATAKLLTSSAVRVDPRLAEQRRGATWFDDAADFRAHVRRAFVARDQSAVPGWEPLAETTARVVPAVVELVEATGDAGSVVLVGHGTAWTVVVAALTDADPDLDAWSQLTMPDHCVVDVAARRLVAGWGAWRVD